MKKTAGFLLVVFIIALAVAVNITSNHELMHDCLAGDVYWDSSAYTYLPLASNYLANTLSGTILLIVTVVLIVGSFMYGIDLIKNN